MRRAAFLLSVGWVLLLCSVVRAGDVYFKVPLEKLKLTEGQLPAPTTEGTDLASDWPDSDDATANFPYVVLHGPGEAFAGAVDDPNVQALVIHTQQAGDISGRIFFAKTEDVGVTVVKFQVPAGEASADSKEGFLRLKRAHYRRLLQSGDPGAAWFRHEVREASTGLGDQKQEEADAVALQQPDNSDNSYELFSGDRAVSESLQLDRALPNAHANKDKVETIDVKTIEGITVPAMDWKDRIKGLSPKVDPLAALIPADQHAIFLPSFAALTALVDELQAARMPILLRAMAQPLNAVTIERYQRELGVSMNTLTRALGPRLVGSVAITGSDPYFAAGSDVAIIFESDDPAALESLLRTEMGLDSAGKTGSGQVRRFGKSVVLSNSAAQLRNIAAAESGAQASLASQPEYIFFRNRYPIGEGDESALVVLSDATIRRWCGPRWRIGQSRRLRAAAVMSELQATWLDGIARGDLKAGPIYSDLHLVDLGELSLSAAGVSSSVYGSLEMMKPISELPLDTVTAAEADSYKRWREGYEQNWRWAFDPIGARISIGEKKLGADVTVMPLIWGSDYRDMVAIAQGVSFAPDAGDPHDSLLHLIVAINRKAMMVQSGENFAANMAPGLQADPFGWLGSSVSLYADDDPFWDELAKAGKPSDFLENNFQRLPIAVRAEVSNGLKLTGFLVAFRAFMEQTAPQMTVWESLSYKDHPYVKISPSAMAKGQYKEAANLAIYYAASGDSLLITLNEALLRRAIDRQVAQGGAKREGKAVTTQPWLGSSVALRAEAKVFDLVMQSNRKDSERFMQGLAWKNLAVLNEWKRRYPDQDPVKLEEHVWGVRLVDPAGGQYVWNEKWQTMESTNYGQPGEPKDGPLGNEGWSGAKRGEFGLTFEEQGMRARAELERNSASP